MKIYLAEFIGTCWLVIGGCGSAVLAAAFPGVGIGLLGVSLAFGLTVLTIAYSLGPISGAHLNPAVTIGLVAAGKFEARMAPMYILAQVLGAIAGAAFLYIVATGNGTQIGDFAANGYRSHSPGKYGMKAAIVTEFMMTAMFLFIILGATAKRAANGFAGITIGMALTLIHLISIPVTNTSVNPARSISQAVFVGGWAIEQLWLFILIPIAGAAVAGLLYRYLLDEPA
ncbi:aquaporin Z [Flavihumibacter cheonanensis]|uniref:aquaporin Z n=1 Tax=Flavihumibacter cheonanensis TaxID=1442385 RepID=UPI001EF83AC2|nr:aquaporin Z [Flavihumibacter cheonanensis]MCG7753180.1 aquaporin Z [Flavihumibacter cheonanensis]